MENYVKKWLRRLTTSLSMAIVVVLCLTVAVMAAPELITDFTGIAYSTEIKLSWIPAESSNTTVIRYSTTTYPAGVGDGTSAYNETGSYVTVTGLTAGTTYYFSAWGYDGTDYSATYAGLVLSTISATSENTTIPYTDPTIPAEAYQDPDISGWSIDPIDKILDYFADEPYAHGGLGMPTKNLVMFLAGVAVTFVGLGTYVKWRSFFSSWFIVLILSSFAASIEVMQWIVVGFLLLVGAGVWAVENSTQ